MCRICGALFSSSQPPRLRMTSTPLCMSKGRDESRPVHMMANNAAGYKPKAQAQQKRMLEPFGSRRGSCGGIVVVRLVFLSLEYNTYARQSHIRLLLFNEYLCIGKSIHIHKITSIQCTTYIPCGAPCAVSAFLLLSLLVFG